MEKREKGDSYSHILKYTSLFGGVQGLNILVSVVRTKLVAMILGPDGMGLVSLFNSTIKLVSDSTNLGLPMSAVKNVSEAFDSGSPLRVQRAVGLVRLWDLRLGRPHAPLRAAVARCGSAGCHGRGGRHPQGHAPIAGSCRRLRV